MSQFEFLRSIPVGQYLPIDSVFHRLDPRARLVGVVIVLMAITFAAGLIGLLVGLAVVIAGLILARVPLRFALRGLLTPLPFLLILAVLQVFWNAGPDTPPVLWSWEIIQLTVSDIRYGAALLFRFCGLVLGLGLLSYTTSTSQLTQGLNGLLRPLRRLNLPVDDLVMMVQITLRFLPLLAQTAERIAMAQAARGADWDARSYNIVKRVRQIFPMIVPLFITSLNRASNLAMAMDARGYGAGERTSMVELKMMPRDWLILICAGMGGMLILVAR